MRLEKVQEALNTKNIKYEYTEENGCGSLDFMYGNMKTASGAPRRMYLKLAEVRISREITKKSFPVKSSHGRI